MQKKISKKHEELPCTTYENIYSLNTNMYILITYSGYVHRDPNLTPAFVKGFGSQTGLPKAKGTSSTGLLQMKQRTHLILM